MNLSALCMNRPAATGMFWLGVMVAGLVCWTRLPISALPRYETPVIEVHTKLPGASPENISMSVATPLEKEFSSIPGLLTSTSQNIQGESRIQLEFAASRDIDAAAADVQAALFRVTRALPPELPAPPSYKKINPGDAPILNLGLSSPTLSLADLNAYIDELVVPALSTVEGVAQVNAKGQKRYAVRVQVDPERLAALDLTLPEVADALRAANANTPLGQLDNSRQMLALQMPDALMRAADFADVAVATRGGRTIRLADVAVVRDSYENVHNASAVDGRDAVMLDIRRQPGANIVQTVEAIHALLPRLQSQLPGSVRIQVVGDRAEAVRDAIHDVNLTLLLTIALVVLVILLFLRRASATFIPSATVPISLLGTFGLMHALGLSLNNISLMGLTIAVGLVVDDAIVVLENIMRHIERGMSPVRAASEGAREVGFTVISISLALVAVFIPIFLMPGTIGLLFHEFALVVSIAVLVSAAVSLTLVPVLVPLLVKARPQSAAAGGSGRGFEAAFQRLLSGYRHSLEWALARRGAVLAAGAGTLVLTVALYALSPKGFFPQEDTGQVKVKVRTAQDMSFEGRRQVLERLQAVLLQDPAIRTLSSKVDHKGIDFDIDLVARAQRGPLPEVLARMRAGTDFLPGVTANFSPVQSLRVGASTASGSYQYTLQSVGQDDLHGWAERLLAALRQSDALVDVDTDFEQSGLQAEVVVDRERMARLGVDAAALRDTLYGAFGMREVSTIYAPQASYKVIMELADDKRLDEAALSLVRVRGADGQLVPLGSFAEVRRANGTVQIAHKAQLPAVTLSFELADGHSLSDAAAAIEAARAAIGMPVTVFGAFDGQAALYEQSQTAQIWLILIAVAVIYLVLGMLYESWIHPVTILMGIPSATMGALLALRLLGLELTFIAMVGILLLIGVVMKNAIMMIDFALAAQRGSGLAAEQAIRQACLLRFRPILMTTLCALMGALPIAFGLGTGAELRQPLGVAVVGGLVFSQLITLYLTPVIYLGFERLRIGIRRPALQSATAG